VEAHPEKEWNFDNLLLNEMYYWLDKQDAHSRYVLK
jgi:hypothetical protein